VLNPHSLQDRNLFGLQDHYYKSKCKPEVVKVSIGERIKQARRIRGLSQRELARSASVSAQAVSKYERDLDLPSSGVLLRLSKALNIGIEFFVRPQRVPKITPHYRKHCAMPHRAESSIRAKIIDWLEKYLEIESILSFDKDKLGFNFPEGFPRKVRSMAEIEKAAVDLRRAWDLGMDSIENLTSLLEDKGIKVGIIDANDDFDACTFDAGDDGKITVIVIRSNMPGDRQRFTLAHELGHLMLEPQNELDLEKAAHRFAGAFLVPEAVARFELRDRRLNLSDYELHMLKDKYGLSMQAWIYRAKDLGILPEERAIALFKKFKSSGWYVQEPGEPYPSEQPMRFEKLVMYAWAEGIISGGRASELLGKSIEQFLSEVAGKHGGLVAAVCN
jgi:Zn-dependent peptidase ImmA (M78 family)/DNA-binding XRE family transcriptional regulator